MLYDAHNQGGNPNNNPLCGHKIRATHGGKSLILTVVDRCMFPTFFLCELVWRIRSEEVNARLEGIVGRRRNKLANVEGTGEACAAGDIDLSPGAFKKLEDLDAGRVPVTWTWLDPKPEGV